MVKSRIQPGEYHPLKYWILKRCPPANVMRSYLNSRGVPCPHGKSAHLQRMFWRVRHRLFLYDQCSLEELEEFCTNRGLSIERTSFSHRTGLIARLETADMDSALHRFLELPPELRVQIFRHYFKDLRCSLHRKYRDWPYAQPPIAAASRIIRKEALPEFYEIFSFKFDVSLSLWRGLIGVPGVRGADFMERASQETLDMLKIVTFVGEMPLGNGISVSWQVEFDVKAGSAKVQLAHLHQDRPAAWKCGQTPERIRQMVQRRVDMFIEDRRSPSGKFRFGQNDLDAIEDFFKSANGIRARGRHVKF